MNPINNHKRQRGILFTLTCQFLFLTSLYAQDRGIITGRITDSETGEPLTGATVVLNDSTGISSDTDGKYELKVLPGTYKISFQFVGYQSAVIEITAFAKDTVRIDVILEVKIKVLDEIVVTAGKFDQKLSDVTVSMEVLKPVMIQQNNHITLETLISQVPGIDVLDGQASIRGGSGYSYGAGSRVLVLVDDLPIISADVGDVKWDYLPVENVAQVEILKGASSVLYGSSALNGVINLRTAFPKPDPETGIIAFSGVYMDPKREELVWWDRQPVFYGMNFQHMRKIRNLDLVVSGNLLHNPGYRENEWDTWGRGNLKLNVTGKRNKGLNYGINSSYMYQDKSDFLLWIHADTAYRQNPEAVSELTGIRFNADPYVIFRQKKNIIHTLKTRFFAVDNRFPNDADKNNKSCFYYGEYRYLQKFKNEIHWSFGSSASYSNVLSNLYGNHSGTNLALYTQLDARFFERLKWSAGIRWESSRLDNERIHSSPVFRTGINFQAAEYTYLRGSIGQGYRFPSIAEKFTATSISSLKIFPNPDLEPEKGWSAEIGIKQGIKLGSWQGYADLSGFWTEYNDMIEFTFGIYKPDSIEIPTLEHIGFKSLNVGNARINGFEINLTMQGEIGPVAVDLTTGYTFMNPIDRNVRQSTLIENEKYLKYRYKHSFKGDVQCTWRIFSTGFNLKFYSFMLNVDPVFVDPLFGTMILPGYADYREENKKGEWVVDYRISYDIIEQFKLSLIIKNLLNEEYIGRPGDIGPPRNITLQLSATF